MADDLRRCGLRDADQIFQRYHRPAVGAHVELLHVLRRGAELLVRLDVDAIGPIVEVEIVHVSRSHVDAQRVGNLRERNVQALRLLAIDGHQILRIVRGERRDTADQIFALRLLAGSCRGLHSASSSQRVRRLILHYELESAKLSQALHGRGKRGKHDCPRNRKQTGTDAVQNCRRRMLLALALGIWLQAERK